MDKKILPMFALVILGLGLGGCSLLEKTASGPALDMDTNMEVKTELPSGEESQAQLEEQQKVDPKDDGLSTIESELDSTVILKEDFSDL